MSERRNLRVDTRGEKGLTLPSKGPLEDEIRVKCQEIADFLVEKNRAYGSSVEKPLRVFAPNVDRLTLIKIRLDDKISRLARGNALPEESLRDTRRDLIGYLILLEVLEGLGEGKNQSGDG